MELRGNDRIKKSSYTVHHNKDKNNSEDASILGATKQPKIRNMPTKRPAPGAKSLIGPVSVKSVGVLPGY